MHLFKKSFTDFSKFYDINNERSLEEMKTKGYKEILREYNEYRQEEVEYSYEYNKIDIEGKYDFN